MDNVQSQPPGNEVVVLRPSIAQKLVITISGSVVLGMGLIWLVLGVFILLNYFVPGPLDRSLGESIVCGLSGVVFGALLVYGSAITIHAWSRRCSLQREGLVISQPRLFAPMSTRDVPWSAIRDVYTGRTKWGGIRLRIVLEDGDVLRLSGFYDVVDTAIRFIASNVSASSVKDWSEKW